MSRPRENNLPQRDEKMKTANRQVATTDSARLIEALKTNGIRVGVQVDGERTTLIFTECEAQRAAETIANELSR